MAGVLELAQLLQDDGVAEVDVRRRRVDPELDAQRPALGQPRAPARPRAGSRRRCGSGRRRRTSVAAMVESRLLRGPSAAAFFSPRLWQPRHPDPQSRPRSASCGCSCVLSGLGVLAVISAVFGMMMAVASDLPEIDVLDVSTRPSHIYRPRRQRPRRPDRQREPPARALRRDRAGDEARDRRHRGPPLLHELRRRPARHRPRRSSRTSSSGSAAQGGSTIAQQLVKNRLEAQNDRTIFQKLRESAMAFHMTRKWDKERILRNYLNTIYFGNGAYGIEAAARTYFGDRPRPRRRRRPSAAASATQRRCAELLEPQQAALIAGVVANPTRLRPRRAPRRRQGAPRPRPRCACASRTTSPARVRGRGRRAAAAPATTSTRRSRPPSTRTSRPGSASRSSTRSAPAAPSRAACRSRRRSTPELQEAAQGADHPVARPDARPQRRPGRGPWSCSTTTPARCWRWSAAQDRSYNERPFNLATQGQRQPGSSFKPFILAAGARGGHQPRPRPSTLAQEGVLRHREARAKCIEAFVVNNYDDAYAGVTTLANATAFSDNSVYAELGIEVGTQEDRQAGPQARRAHAGLDQLRDDARRPQGGRHRARHGPRLRVLRRRRRARLRLAEPGRRGVRATTTRRAPSPARSASSKIIEPDGPRHGKSDPQLLNGKKAVNKTKEERVLDEDVAANVAVAAPGRRPDRLRQARRGRPASPWPARPARRRTTATPGSSAGRRSTPSRSGSATRTPSSRWSRRPSPSTASPSPAAPTPPSIFAHLHERRAGDPPARTTTTTRARPGRPATGDARPGTTAPSTDDRAEHGRPRTTPSARRAGARAAPETEHRARARAGAPARRRRSSRRRRPRTPAARPRATTP